jgi:hypothetical protein
MGRFAAEQPTTWRDRNEGVCDSPNLYFAVLPNGDFAPCCDHRTTRSISCLDPKFPEVYWEKTFRREVLAITSACSGCMYGSYPEMTISMRHLRVKMDRLKLFLTSPPPKPWPVSYENLLAAAERIRQEPRDRIQLPGQQQRLRLAGEAQGPVAELA